MVLVWSREFWLGPAEVASFVFLVLFKDGGCRVTPRFHLFVYEVKDTYREKLPSNKIPALTKSINVDIWVIGTSKQVFKKEVLKLK